VKKSHQTVDFAELYKDISMVQLGDYQHHSQYYEALVDAKEKEIQNEMDNEKKVLNQKLLEKTMAQSGKVVTPGSTERRHPNPSVDFDEMYEGVKLVQLNSEFTHDNDPDDIVADNAAVYQEKKDDVKDDTLMRVDFQGEKFTEDY